MKFGQVDDPGALDLHLPDSHADTFKLLNERNAKAFQAYVGCAKWNKQDLRNFYPRGTKNELEYYSTQFNAIELNATFYQSPSKDGVLSWKSKVGADFKFFPKVPSQISHYRRLKDVAAPLKAFCDAVSLFEDKLGMVFLQLHENFGTKQLPVLEAFFLDFPREIPLAAEVRHRDWFSNQQLADDYYKLLLNYNIANVIVDTAGRRDMLHMRLSTPQAFIRYVGANHKSDYSRLDEWVERVVEWKNAGLQALYFFVHQNLERESPLLTAYFIEKLNERLDLALTIPKAAKEAQQSLNL